MIQARECPIEFAVINRPQGNRPELPMTSPSHVVFHEVGNMNPGANEDMHKVFVWNGGGENSVSFHFVIGPTKAIQLLYLNENAWHASDGYWGWGNRDAFGIEHIQIGDYERTLQHSVWVMAELFRNPGRFMWRPDYAIFDDLDPALIKERVVQHHQTAPDKKWCPQLMLNSGRWGEYLESVNRELNKPVPVAYKPPVLPSWWSQTAIEQPIDRELNGIPLYYVKRPYTALRSTPVLSTVGGAKARRNLAIGETVQGYYRFKSKGGPWYVLTKYGSRIRASALDPYISMKEVTQ